MLKLKSDIGIGLVENKELLIKLLYLIGFRLETIERNVDNYYSECYQSNFFNIYIEYSEKESNVFFVSMYDKHDDFIFCNLSIDQSLNEIKKIFQVEIRKAKIKKIY